MSGPSFTAGRDIKGAFATGDHASATATISETVAPDPGVDIAAALAALRTILAAVPGIETKALTRIDEAREEAAKPMPRRDEVKSLVAQAAGYARDAAVERLSDAPEDKAAVTRRRREQGPVER